ncbi:pentapeptide repeat-containing protein [Pseudomonas sp. B21-040]|uniref:pentapeptide repeat-containing protein n=1 Tax=Pseudomonas sp. B21-040 TaxID=2895486 RepID=UPI0021602B67|nr:pentapeptide repeat-containing protein [Pseudomonas sp. B21-040]UVL43115.1 pentapeptide repeat-containing protein [Pseudomonas sp. B21-040]
MTVTDITFPGEWLDEHTFHLRFIPTAWPEPYGMARASHAEKEKKLEELCDTEFKAVQCPSSLTKFMRFANDLLASMEWISLHTLLLDGDVDLRTGKPISLFSNRLILPSYNNPGSSHFDPEKPDVADTTFSLRARNLQGAIFFNANLRGVDFTAANLRGALLARADLRGAKLGCASSQLNAAGGGNYIGTYADSHTDCTQLQGANFSSAMLQKTSIMGAVFSKTKFYGALLQEVDFSGADLHETDFSYADLSGARMMNATLTNSNMSDATIIGAYLQNAKAMGVNFSRAKLSLALLDGADLSGARFDNANLDGTSFIRVGGFDPVAWDNTWTVSLETLAHERLIAGIWLKAVCDSDYARVALEAVLPPLTSMVNGQHSVSDSPLLKNSELPHRLIERFRDPQKCNGARFFTDVQNKLLEDLANDEVGIRPYADILR